MCILTVSMLLALVSTSSSLKAGFVRLASEQVRISHSFHFAWSWGNASLFWLNAFVLHAP